MARPKILNQLGKVLSVFTKYIGFFDHIFGSVYFELKINRMRPARDRNGDPNIYLQTEFNFFELLSD